MVEYSGSTPVEIAPDKRQRVQCWDSRDRFFQCLDEHYIDNSLDPKEISKVNSKCGDIKQKFEKDCVKSWVKYFQEKRTNDLIRTRYIQKLESEGAQPLPFKIEGVKK
ncbi:uncharacterized protein KGF55_005423 [Candida pseudojiufengensis]|uniref:uncharacterized protein n=1 Tax=Candida pseudojiufengensis TaxID=497109 RepID=UPI00222480A7|nr:uncharacterized protein KGF55_005423 [Candida pseudojiufengensis]KAI5959273.1 hypothetical protein KGF55_005423 [Candida pseudojiufengensis]